MVHVKLVFNYTRGSARKILQVLVEVGCTVKVGESQE